VTPTGLKLVEMAEEVEVEELRKKTGVAFT